MEVDQGINGSLPADGGTFDTPVEIAPDGRLSRSVAVEVGSEGKILSRPLDSRSVAVVES